MQERPQPVAWGALRPECPFRPVFNSGEGARPMYLHVGPAIRYNYPCGMRDRVRFLRRDSAAGGQGALNQEAVGKSPIVSTT